MKTIQNLGLLIVLTLTFSSCYKGGGWGIRGKGEVVSEHRSIHGCDRLNVSVDADVNYVQDSVYFLEVIAQPNILSVLSTEMKGSELSIGYKRNVWDHKDVKVILHTPDMKAIRLSGSGNIQTPRLSTNSLDLTISGSGNITVGNLQSNTMSGKISGSGNIHLDSGKLSNQILTISGSGNIHSENCETAVNTSNISGSGNILVHVTETLKVSISGSGDVKYRGQPSVTVDISGSGNLIKLN